MKHGRTVFSSDEQLNMFVKIRDSVFYHSRFNRVRASSFLYIPYMGRVRLYGQMFVDTWQCKLKAQICIGYLYIL